MDIERKIHFVHLESTFSPEIADYYTQWAIHSPLYEVNIWVHCAIPPVVDIMAASLRRVANVPEWNKVIQTSLMHTTYIEAEVAAHSTSPMAINSTIQLRNYLPEHIVQDEVLLWWNYTAARRLVRMAALYKEGGISIEPFVQPVGRNLPLGIVPPHEVLFYMRDGTPPIFTDAVLACIKKSPKMRQIAEFQERTYIHEYSQTSVHPRGLSDAAAQQLEQLEQARAELTNFEAPNLTKRQRKRKKYVTDQMLLKQMQRTLDRSGVTVLNYWIDRVEGLYKSPQEIADIERSHRRWPEPISYSLHSLALGESWVEVVPREVPNPDAEYFLYSFENIFEYELLLKETVESNATATAGAATDTNEDYVVI